MSKLRYICHLEGIIQSKGWVVYEVNRTLQGQTDIVVPMAEHLPPFNNAVEAQAFLDQPYFTDQSVQGTPRKENGWKGPISVCQVAEYLGPKCLQTLREFYPIEEVGVIAKEPFKEGVRSALEGRSVDCTCYLAKDWLFDEIETHTKRGSSYLFNFGNLSVGHVILKSLYALDDAFRKFHPNASCRAVADFWRSFQVHRHLAQFGGRLVESEITRDHPMAFKADEEVKNAVTRALRQLAAFAHEVTDEFHQSPAAIGPATEPISELQMGMSSTEKLLAELPRLPDLLQRKVKLQWDELVEKRGFTGAHLNPEWKVGHPKSSKAPPPPFTVVGPGSSYHGPATESSNDSTESSLKIVWSQWAEQARDKVAIKESVDLANARFLQLATEYFEYWSVQETAGRSELFKTWVEGIQAHIMNEIAKLWKNRDGWFERVCLVPVNSSLQPLTKEWHAKARQFEIERIEAVTNHKSLGVFDQPIPPDMARRIESGRRILEEKAVASLNANLSQTLKRDTLLTSPHSSAIDVKSGNAEVSSVESSSQADGLSLIVAEKKPRTTFQEAFEKFKVSIDPNAKVTIGEIQSIVASIKPNTPAQNDPLQQNNTIDPSAILEEKIQDLPIEPSIDELSALRSIRILEYKKANPGVTDYQIYNAKNSGVHKPEFYRYVKGTLSSESETCKNFERFLAEKKTPNKRIKRAKSN